jgi:hypothetical protein
MEQFVKEEVTFAASQVVTSSSAGTKVAKTSSQPGTKGSETVTFVRVKLPLNMALFADCYTRTEVKPIWKEYLGAGC